MGGPLTPLHSQRPSPTRGEGKNLGMFTPSPLMGRAGEGVVSKAIALPQTLDL
jgi:hypothetical protein